MKGHKTRKWTNMALPTIRELAKRYWVFVTVGSVSFYLFSRELFGNTSNGKVIDVDSWLKTPYFACGINFIGYGQKFAVLRNAHVDITNKKFVIPCTGEKPQYLFEADGITGNIKTVKYLMKGNVLNGWVKNMSIFDISSVKKYKMTAVKSTTFAVSRIEAHNLYHAMTEWYSLLLISVLLNFDPKQIDVLLMDDRPFNTLDETWSTLFGKVSRYNSIPPDNVFKTLVWNIFGYESPMNDPGLAELPYLTEFRDLVLESFGIPQIESLNCNRLSVTVILRQDYRSHPELKDGRVLRKFENDSAVLENVKVVFKGHEVNGIYLENYSMKEQLEIITNTDILVAMHGAGLSHILFLPAHAGCFEMFPKYVDDFIFFKAFSRWRGTKYLSWKNLDSKNEFTNYRTKIPSEVLFKHLNILKQSICN